MNEPEPYVLGFTDGTIYQVYDVVSARVDDVKTPTPRLTLELGDDLAFRANYAAVKFVTSLAVYRAKVTPL